MGGARPKALIDIAGHQWVIKFSDGDPADTPLIEHATMTLAQMAGIGARDDAGATDAGHAIAIKRFDRKADYGGTAYPPAWHCEPRVNSSDTRNWHSCCDVGA